MHCTDFGVDRGDAAGGATWIFRGRDGADDGSDGPPTSRGAATDGATFRATIRGPDRPSGRVPAQAPAPQRLQSRSAPGPDEMLADDGDQKERLEAILFATETFGDVAAPAAEAAAAPTSSRRRRTSAPGRAKRTSTSKVSAAAARAAAAEAASKASAASEATSKVAAAAAAVAAAPAPAPLAARPLSPGAARRRVEAFAFLHEVGRMVRDRAVLIRPWTRPRRRRGRRADPSAGTIRGGRREDFDHFRGVGLLVSSTRRP